jgi:hypothetical protein
MTDSKKLFRGQTGPNPLFGKNYGVRPGAKIMMEKNPNAKNPKIVMPKPRNKDNYWDSIMRPGAIVQDQIKKVYDFDKIRANDIFKFGQKVHLDDKQFNYSFTDKDGKIVTKGLTELNYDIHKKLEELKLVTASGVIQSIEQRMGIVNALDAEMAGKVKELTGNDLNNIRVILNNLGEEIKSPQDVGIKTRYVTYDYFVAHQVELAMFLASQSKGKSLTTFKGKAQDGIESMGFFKGNKSKTVLDLHDSSFHLFQSWAQLEKEIIKHPGLVDGYEYDDHPKS